MDLSETYKNKFHVPQLVTTTNLYINFHALRTKSLATRPLLHVTRYPGDRQIISPKRRKPFFNGFSFIRKKNRTNRIMLITEMGHIKTVQPQKAGRRLSGLWHSPQPQGSTVYKTDSPLFTSGVSTFR